MSAHPDSGIRLQGSVARGDERDDSDIDMTIVVPGNELVVENELLWSGNHLQMQRVHDPVGGVSVDINWIGMRELLDLVADRGAAAWYMFLEGTTLRDPARVVARCEAAIASWFASHPAVLAAWDRQQARVEAFKRGSPEPLKFATQPEFVKHLQSLNER